MAVLPLPRNFVIPNPAAPFAYGGEACLPQAGICFCSSSRSGFDWLHVSLNFRKFLVFGDFQIVLRLKVEPELRRRFEIPSQAQCRVGCDPAPFRDDIRNPSHRHALVKRQFVHAEAIRFHEIFAEDLAWMYRFHLFCHSDLLMVVRNFDFVRIAVAPGETNAPLVVDADAMLALAVTS
jgi:hypothetical protein